MNLTPFPPYLQRAPGAPAGFVERLGPVDAANARYLAVLLAVLDGTGNPQSTQQLPLRADFLKNGIWHTVQKNVLRSWSIDSRWFVLDMATHASWQGTVDGLRIYVAENPIVLAKLDQRRCPRRCRGRRRRRRGRAAGWQAPSKGWQSHGVMRWRSSARHRRSLTGRRHPPRIPGAAARSQDTTRAAIEEAMQEFHDIRARPSAGREAIPFALEDSGRGSRARAGSIACPHLGASNSRGERLE